MALFAASINANAAEIDLHEYHEVFSAMQELESELFALHQAGEQHCRIIHGIGSGVMQQATHNALKKNPMVLAFEQESSGGSTIAVLNK